MHKIFCKRISDDQVIEIDIDAVSNRQTDYMTLSWTSFVDDKPIVKKEENEVVDTELETLRHSYINATGKDVPVRYKNNKERLNNKIQEILDQ